MASDLLDFSANARSMEDEEQPIGAAQQRVANVAKLAPIAADAAGVAGAPSMDFSANARPMEKLAPTPGEEEPEESSTIADFLKLAMPAVRTTIEAGGAMAGGFLGAGGGTVLGGPGVGTTLGAMGGGGLGYAVGSDLADLLETAIGMRKPQSIRVEMTEAAKNIVEGAAFEAGGMALGPALGIAAKAPGVKQTVKGAKDLGKFAWGKVPTLRASSVKEKAGEILAANLGRTNLVAKNIEEARVLEETIPGLKFSRAQTTDDPNVIRFEKALRTSKSEFATQQQQAMAENVQAVKDFLHKQRGTGEITDARKVLEAERELIETGVTEARKGLQEATGALEMGQDAIEAGQTIRQAARSGETAARREAGKRFGQVAEVEFEADKLLAKLDDIAKPFSKIENVEKNVPGAFSRVRRIAEEQGNIFSIDDLQGFRSELGEELRDISRAANPNNRRKSRLTQAVSAIDDFIGQADELIPEKAAAQKLKEARGYFKREVIDRFRTGNVDQILKQGSSGDKVSDAQIVSRFFKPGAVGKESATQFLNAVGDNPDARRAMKDAIGQDLVSKATNPRTMELDTGKLKRWLFTNKPALKKLGLEGEFSTVAAARQQLDTALDMQKEYAKTEASRLLDAAVGSEVDKAIASKDMGKSMLQLMRRLKGNKRAIEGVQNQLIDKIAEVAPTKINQIETIMKRYKPALQAAFTKDKEKLRALDTYQKALARLKFSEKNIAAGSETAEKLVTWINKFMGLAPVRALSSAKFIIAPLQKMSADKVNETLMKASLDPDFAYNLMSLAKSKKVTDKARQNLWRGYLGVSAGLGAESIKAGIENLKE